jgi:hypothetical protein
MMPRLVPVLLAATLLALAPGCRTPGGEFTGSVPGIDPSDVGLTRALWQLDSEIRELEKTLGRYPARFASDKERLLAHSQWSAAVEVSIVLLNVDLENAELFARAGNLYRLGYNLGVPEAFSAAYRTLGRCIELSKDHVDCFYRLAQLMLTSTPRYAPTAERLLLRARSLISPQTRPELEAELARAYFAQGQRSAALQQIDYYLTLRPDDVDAQRFRDRLTGREISDDKPRGAGGRGPLR